MENEITQKYESMKELANDLTNNKSSNFNYYYIFEKNSPDIYELRIEGLGIYSEKTLINEIIDFTKYLEII